MAKAQALTLKDLIATQEKMAAKGDPAALRSLQKLQALSEQVKQEEKEAAAKQSTDAADLNERVEDLSKTMEKGLLEKTGDGLNSNVIKLTKEMRAQMLADKKGSEPQAPGNDASKTIANPRATAEQRTAEQAKRYVPGTKDFLKDKFNFKMPEKGSGVKGFAGALKGSVKGMLSLENMIDTSEGKNTGGLLGGQLRRTVERRQYAKDRFDTEKGRYQNLLKKDEAGNVTPEARKKAEATFRRQYDESMATRGQMKENEGEVSRLREKGFSEDDIKRTGRLDTRETLDTDLRKSDAQYRAQRKEDEKGAPATVAEEPKEKTARKPKAVKAATEEIGTAPIASKVTPLEALTPDQQATKDRMDEALRTGKVQPIRATPIASVPSAAAVTPITTNPTEASATPAASNVIPFPTKASSLLSGATSEESQDETLRTTQQQSATLDRIDKSTAASAAALNKMAGMPAVGTAAAAGGGGNEGGGSLLETGVDMLGKGKGLLGKAKGLGSSLLKNPKMLGKAGAALAVVGGAYTAYKGISEASEEEDKAKAEVDAAVDAGKITPTEASSIKAKVTDEASVKKGSAAGEGTGMAVGGIAGMKVGATIGTMIGGPVGTVVGGALGGLAGAAAGSSLGKKVGGSIVSGYQSARNFFTGDKKAEGATPETAAAAAVTPVAPVQVAGAGAKEVAPEDKVKRLEQMKERLEKQGPRTKSAQSAQSHEDQLRTLDKAIVAEKGRAAGGDGTLVAGEAVIPGQKPSAKQMAAMEMSKKAEAVQAPAPQGANAVYNQSGQNAGVAAQPTVVPIIAPTTNNTSTNVNNTTQSAAKSPPRNTESSIQQYNRQRYAF